MPTEPTTELKFLPLPCNFPGVPGIMIRKIQFTDVGHRLTLFSLFFVTRRRNPRVYLSRAKVGKRNFHWNSETDLQLVPRHLGQENHDDEGNSRLEMGERVSNISALERRITVWFVFATYNPEREIENRFEAISVKFEPGTGDRFSSNDRGNNVKEDLKDFRIQRTKFMG